VQAEILHGRTARESVFRALLNGRRSYADHIGYDDITLRRCQLGNCAIALVEHLTLCTAEFVDFCLEKDYSNIGFVRIGHIEE
jgi:hypothetical protein